VRLNVAPPRRAEPGEHLLAPREVAQPEEVGDEPRRLVAQELGEERRIRGAERIEGGARRLGGGRDRGRAARGRAHDLVEQLAIRGDAERVEQVMSQPGSIRKLHVVAVVRKALDAAQQRQIQELVAASVGASLARGDTVVLQTMDAIASPATAPDAAAPEPVADVAAAPQRASGSAHGRADGWIPSRVEIAAIAVAVAAMIAVLWRSAPSRRQRTSAAVAAPALTDAQRQATLAQVRAWMRADAARSPRELS
jgi:flagellar M-ring protein FliF